MLIHAGLFVFSQQSQQDHQRQGQTAATSHFLAEAYLRKKKATSLTAVVCAVCHHVRSNAFLNRLGSRVLPPPLTEVSHVMLKCRWSQWEHMECTTHVQNAAVARFSPCPPCSTELSPICPSLNICCGIAAGAGSPFVPVSARWARLWLAAAMSGPQPKSPSWEATCWHGFPDCLVVIDTSLS